MQADNHSNVSILRAQNLRDGITPLIGNIRIICCIHSCFYSWGFLKPSIFLSLIRRSSAILSGLDREQGSPFAGGKVSQPAENVSAGATSSASAVENVITQRAWW